jgi:hypothetical protein
MRWGLVGLAVAAVAPAQVEAAGPALTYAAALRSSASALVSANWAGYAIAGQTTDTLDPAAPAATPSSFTSITGTWTQPAAACTSRRPAYSAVWIGLGGLDSGAQALEQIGTDADCTAGGTPVYDAWYELVPAPPVNLKLKVAPGDTITASVNVGGTSVLVQVKDRTRRTSVTRRLTLAAPDVSSAEWIVEAPADCNRLGVCKPLPLANFGSVTFSRIAVTGDGHPGTLADAAWAATPISLVPSRDEGTIFGRDLGQSRAGAVPAGFSADGRSFTVAWQAVAGGP